MDKLSNYSDYSGTDFSNEISLYEYGLLCKKQDNNDIHCIIGAGVDKSGNYNKFCSSSITEEDIEIITNESWFDKESFLSFVGMTSSDWNNSGYINKIADMISYYGLENIFGSPYNYFEIENE